MCEPDVACSRGGDGGSGERERHHRSNAFRTTTTIIFSPASPLPAMDFGLNRLSRSSYEFPEDVLATELSMSSEISQDTMGTFGQNRRSRYESSPTSPCFVVDELNEPILNYPPDSPLAMTKNITIPPVLVPIDGLLFRHPSRKASTDSLLSISTVSSKHIKPKQRTTGGPSDAPMPFELLWLRDTTIKMMIEQEAFRTVSPTFSYAGYSPTSGLAYFMPPKREIFIFHYLLFDTALPILRRITLNEDDNKDHISRHVNLVLKQNGVYTVSGTEYAIGTGEALEWHFEYTANVRNIHGKPQNEGERTLTPLTFSCNPRLLLPGQGRKVKLMQVMHKSIIGKLTSTKLDPPDPSRLGGPMVELPGNADSLKVLPAADATSTRFMKLWNSHRRAMSHAPGVENISPIASPTKRTTPSGTSPTVRRRRSSSAGQSEQPNISALAKSGYLSHRILDSSQAVLSSFL